MDIPLLLLLLPLAWMGVESRTILDLTHTFDQDAPKWPLWGFGLTNFTYYGMQSLYANTDANGMWLALNKVEFYEHLGTHIDAPLHFGEGKQATHEIPPERLIGPGVVIDVREEVKTDMNYAVTVDDIQAYEMMHGRIPTGSIVLMNSGWSERFQDPKLNFGTDNVTDPTSFNFPGFSKEACQWLHQERQVSVVGVDTPSVDPGQTDDYYCHRYLQPLNVPLLEYVANLDTLPLAGSTVVLGSMKHRGGTGGPTRILAIVGDDTGNSNGAGNGALSHSLMVAALAGVWYMYLCC